MNQTQQPRGTVLLELVVVIAMLGAAIIGVYSALIYGQTVVRKAHHLARASQIAAAQVENVRATSFANLVTPYIGAFIGTGDPVTELPTGSANLTTSWYNSPTNTIKKAVITVTWTERTVTKSVQYTTLVVNNGLYQ